MDNGYTDIGLIERFLDGSLDEQLIEMVKRRISEDPAFNLLYKKERFLEKGIHYSFLKTKLEQIKLLEKGLEGKESGESTKTIFLAYWKPLAAAAGLLQQIQPQLSTMLGKIQYTSSVAVALAYEKADLPPGFGFLVPRTEARKIMACTFVHKKFSHRVTEGAFLLRCFFSSSRMPDLLSFNDEALQEMARKELKEILGLDSPPLFARTFRWDCAMPQYETGHLERVAEMEKMLAGLPGVQVIGNSFYGIGIPDCIKSARQAVEKITSAVSLPVSV